MRLITALALTCFATAANAGAAPKTDIKVTWLGHATFEVTAGATTVLIDPFLEGNPATPAEFKKLDRYKPTAILVSHSHPDHSADAEKIAKTSGAKVISSYEWVAALKLPDAQKVGGNVGGAFPIGEGADKIVVSLVPAMHSSEPNGRPLGFVLTFADGRSIYHTGDTWVFGDMTLIQEIYKPTILLLNVGGGPYTQDAKAAALAVKKYFKPTTIIPMHYATFPGLQQQTDVDAAFKGDKRLKVMKAGESTSL